MELTHTREEETGRMDRLESVAGALKEFKPELVNQIERLHDHKGCLEVYWRTDSPGDAMGILKQLWNAQNEYHLEHYNPGGNLIQEDYWN